MLLLFYKDSRGCYICQYFQYNTPTQFNCSTSLWCVLETNCQNPLDLYIDNSGGLESNGHFFGSETKAKSI